MDYKKTLSFKSFIKSKYYCSKHKNYFEVYDRLFSSYRNKKNNLCRYWCFLRRITFHVEKLFGKKAKIIGVELNPLAKKFEKYGFKIFIGDQSNPIFGKISLRRLARSILFLMMVAIQIISKL